MTAPINTGHLRQVGLTLAEVKTITYLADNQGEVLWVAEYAKPEARALIGKLVEKQLVELRKEPLSNKSKLRLTDQGRCVAAQLEAMAIKPKIVSASA